MAEKPIKTPLPADLPENWNAGQIVAPDGTSVGLTEQHGYNYLMEMVNRSQLSINIINEFVADLADVLNPLENWYENSLPSSRIWKKIVYGNGKFVALGSTIIINETTTAAFAYSTDAITWLETLVAQEKGISWYGLTHGDGKFVAIGTISGAPAKAAFAYSTDGIQWTYVEKNDIGAIYYGIAYGNGKFVAINGLQAISSADGIDWEYHIIDNDAIRFEPFQGIAFGEGKFVSIGVDSGQAIYSEDGINWSKASEFVIKNIRSIAYGAGKFVAVGDNGAVYSSNGIQWRDSNIPNGIFNDISFGFCGFVAVGRADDISNSGIVAYSKDGIDWDVVTNPPSFRLKSVAYGNGRFAVISDQYGFSGETNKAAHSGIIGGGQGEPGAPGPGVPAGGAAGQILSKKTATDYDAQWIDPPEVGGATGVSSFNGRSGEVVPGNNDYTAAMVGARPSDWMPTAADVGAVSSPTVTAIQVVTQAEYDALTTKNASVLYLIKE